MYVPYTTDIPKEKLNSVAVSPFEYFNRFDRFSTATRLVVTICRFIMLYSLLKCDEEHFTKRENYDFMYETKIFV